MPVSAHYIEFIQDLLGDFEPLRIKRMFGGAGVYSGDLFFAILAEDTLYLKVDDGNRGGYEALGIQPFAYPIFVTLAVSSAFFQCVRTESQRLWALHLRHLGVRVDEGLLGLARQMR